MPKKRSVDAETQSSADDDGETQILLNTETKPSLNAWKHGAYSNLVEEIELGDRLDARIDRLVKRLLHLKAAKQMI
jgi:hypothetical protein